MGRVTARRRIIKVDAATGSRTDRPDTLAVEEPLEIRLNGEPWVVTMRTPGNDIELAHGFLHSEGVIRSPDDVITARYCLGATLGPSDDDIVPTRNANTYNVLNVSLAPGVTRPAARETGVTSACGMCGADSIEAVRVRGSYGVAADPVTVTAETLVGLPDVLRRNQAVFDKTGGLHGAGLFTAEGELVCAREDVGRHNAVDKVVGWALLENRLPLTGHVLQLSGRASFELVQKAYLAGIPVVSAVSAPSSLAAETADELGVTLAGFVRGTSLNLYTRPDRVTTHRFPVMKGDPASVVTDEMVADLRDG